MHDSTELAKRLGQKLLAQNKTVTTVESCTGGGIASAITDIEGSSQWFQQGFVTYSNEAKQAAVKVSAKTLKDYGAVSKQTVEEMAVGALGIANADIAISVSGIAGPGGGTPSKPVGLVWFGIAHRIPKPMKVSDRNKNFYCQHEKINVTGFKRNFDGDRHMVRNQAVITALEKLIESLVN